VPAVSVAVALFLLGEQPTWALIIALALILAGVAIGMLGSTSRPSGS
jgi:drug/metabolite transporter (DMT)-like permease